MSNNERVLYKLTDELIEAIEAKDDHTIEKLQKELTAFSRAVVRKTKKSEEVC